MPKNQWETPRRSSWIRCRVISGLLSAFLLLGVFRMRATQFIEGKIQVCSAGSACPFSSDDVRCGGSLDAGRFGSAADVSAVSTGSQIMQTATVIVTVLAMGITILTGSRRSGSRSRRKPAAFLWEESFCLLHRCSFNGSHTAESSSSGPTHACSPHRP